MLRDQGASHSALSHETGLAFVVKRCTIDYAYPARLDDVLEVCSLAERIGGASLDLDQWIYRADALLVSIKVKLALVDREMRPARLPKALIAALSPQYRAGT